MQKDIDRFMKRLIKAADSFTYNASTKTFERIAIRNPVLTGLSVGDWQVSIGAPASDSQDRLDPSKTATMTDIKAKTPKQAGKNVYFTNNVDYIGLLEGGSSSKAPEGMVAVTFDQMETIIKETVKETKG